MIGWSRSCRTGLYRRKEELALHTILFDLDGTLLPMDDGAFQEIYNRGLLSAIPCPDPKGLLRAIWTGVKVMTQNDGARTNSEAFWEHFLRETGLDCETCEEGFLRYYTGAFRDCVAACRPSPLSREIVDTLREKGYTVALATTPLFPREATAVRLGWAGLEEAQFALVSTYEDFHFAKPSPNYFREFCARLGVDTADCLHIGNDVWEDGAAREAGLSVALVTDCLINRRELPLDGYPLYTLEQLAVWARQLPPCV